MAFSFLIAALDWETLLWWLKVVPMVALGLGAVIFVHELGHFLVAKACGVKCEKFMIGFDIGGYKIARQWGETLYGIGIMPLGGYVKMLGQDDDPAHIAEQMKKSQVDSRSSDAVPIRGPSGETYYVDRRSYLAKNVPQRMAIISAGVIMNIIFAFIFAVVAYGMGVKYQPSIVSETIPGSPAWQAGLEPGDEIVKIGERANPTYIQLKGSVTLGDIENGIPCEVLRASNRQIESLRLKPRQEHGELAMIGIISAQSIVLHDDKRHQGTLPNSPAAKATLVAPSSDELAAQKLGPPRFQGGDKIVQIGEVPIADYRDLVAEFAQHPGEPLQVVVERSPAPKSGEKHASADAKPAATRLTFEVPPYEFRDFGFSTKIGPIVAIQADSPAAAAGLKLGDVIESIDGQPAGQQGGWTPSTLPDLMRQAAQQNREVEIVVTRSGSHEKNEKSSEPERATIRVKPRVPRVIYSGLDPNHTCGAEALGIAYRATNEIDSIAPGGPAERAQLLPGDKIAQANIVWPKDENGKADKPLTVDFTKPTANWAGVVAAVQLALPGTKVELTLASKANDKGRVVTVESEPVSKVYFPARGFIYDPVFRTRMANSFTEQLSLGLDETVDNLLLVVRFLRKLGTQVPATMLGGPGTIAAAAGGAASQGISSLLIFLTMLSANLAVVNFLPIPLLDGGHMVFLAYEGLRGRPANERVVVALHTAGFVFLIGLMLFVIGLDIHRWLLT